MKNPSPPHVKPDQTPDTFYATYCAFIKAKAAAYPRLTRLVAMILPFIIYLFITYLYIGPASLTDINKSFFNPSPDSELIVWALNWWPFSLMHHLNPFMTKYIWFPQGFNLAWATAVPTLGIIMAPITLMFGAVVSYNLIALTALALSALACFYLVYYISKHYWAALIAGYIYGFSSYELGQLVGHPSLYVTFLIPLLILLFLLRLNQKMKRIPYVVLSCIMLILQFGISNEVFTTFMLFSFGAIILFYLFSDTSLKKQIIKTSIEFYGSTVLACICLIPYFYYIVTGYGSTPSTLNSPDAYSADLLNYIIPTPVTRLGSSAFQATAARFSGNYSEDGAYLGLPLVLIVVYFAMRHWRKSYTKVLVLLMAILMLFALGPIFHVDGIDTTFHLPWKAALYLPLIRAALPDRFTMYVSLVAAIIVGLWLSYKTTPTKTIAKFSIAIVAVVFILPNSVYSWQDVTVPKVFNSQQVSHYIKKDANIIILPYGIFGSSMYYQYTSGMRFTQSGGYIGFTPPSFSVSPVVGAFYSGVPEPNFKQDLYSFCIAHHVTEIIYTPDTASTIIRAISSLGWPEQRVTNTVIVQVPLDASQQ